MPLRSLTLREFCMSPREAMGPSTKVTGVDVSEAPGASAAWPRALLATALRVTVGAYGCEVALTSARKRAEAAGAGRVALKTPPMEQVTEA